MTNLRIILLVQIGTRHIKLVSSPDYSCFDIYDGDDWLGSRRTMKQALQEAESYAQTTQGE